MAKDNDKKRNYDKLSATTMRIDLPPDLVTEGPVSERKIIRIQTRKPKDEIPKKIIKIQRSSTDDTRYNALLEGIYDAVLITSQEGDIIDANVRALNILGYDKSSLCKLNVTDIISGSDQKLLPLIMSNLQENRFTVIEAYCVRQDGFGFSAEIAANRIFVSQEGELCFFIRDTTARKEVEDKLRRANKMKSLHMLAGGVAHDFNNLLTSVIGHIELAISNMTGRSKTRDDLNTALNDAKQMAELSHRMLAFSGKGILQKRPVNVNNLLHNTVHQLSEIITSNVTVQVSEAATDITIGGEAEILESMIENFIVNAIESIGTSTGSVTISSSIEAINQDYINYHSLEGELKPDNYACIRITDTGYGMDTVMVEKIFDPFFSTKGAGRGLGLSEAQGIVLAHGGAIAVESQIGRGSTFYVLLPLYNEQVEAVSSTSSTTKKMDITGSTVLIADDEPSIRRYSERVLKRYGLNIYLAADGEEAVDQFRAHADEIDLVLLDMFMPKMNGDMALRQIRKIRPNVKILVVSGYTESVYSDRFTDEQRPTGFLYKPFATQDFLNKIIETLQLQQ